MPASKKTSNCMNEVVMRRSSEWAYDWNIVKNPVTIGS